MIIQMTGLSGAGKTTIATGVCKRLISAEISAKDLDGDAYRKTISKNLGFSKSDRHEHLRRLASLARKLEKEYKIIILSVINPYEDIRQEITQLYQAKTVFVKCNLKTLIIRDTKGLYRRALLPPERPEHINNLTGINDVFEAPKKPEVTIRTDLQSPEASIDMLFNYIMTELKKHQY